mgnify:CR=1 FL=1
MNYYTSLINNILDYIEENIHERLYLEDIARHFSISRHHFNRMFKVVSGMTLKQYILGRKLTEALIYISEKNSSILDASIEFGFEYPEVFSRAFKKRFGTAPSNCIGINIKNNMVDKIHLVDRNIINFKGMLTIKGHYKYLDETALLGISLKVDSNSVDFKPRLKGAGENFVELASGSNLDKERLYAIVSCHETDNGEYTVFYGMRNSSLEASADLSRFHIPTGWYASFIYKGDMFDIREVFIDDLYRWIMINEVQLNPNGIGMINIFEKDYAETSEVQILVPVKRNKIQQD